MSDLTPAQSELVASCLEASEILNENQFISFAFADAHRLVFQTRLITTVINGQEYAVDTFYCEINPLDENKPYVARWTNAQHDKYAKYFFPGGTFCFGTEERAIQLRECAVSGEYIPAAFMMLEAIALVNEEDKAYVELCYPKVIKASGTLNPPSPPAKEKITSWLKKTLGRARSVLR